MNAPTATRQRRPSGQPRRLVDDELERYVVALVDAAPPLTAEQAQRLRVFLHGAAR